MSDVSLEFESEEKVLKLVQICKLESIATDHSIKNSPGNFFCPYLRPVDQKKCQYVEEKQCWIEYKGRSMIRPYCNKWKCGGVQ